jgi:hypothetical protein
MPNVLLKEAACCLLFCSLSRSLKVNTQDDGVSMLWLAGLATPFLLKGLPRTFLFVGERRTRFDVSGEASCGVEKWRELLSALLSASVHRQAFSLPFLFAMQSLLLQTLSARLGLKGRVRSLFTSTIKNA